jgi:hypothetical protein
LHKFKTNDQSEKGGQLQGRCLIFGRDAIALILKSKLQLRIRLNKSQIEDQCELSHVFCRLSLLNETVRFVKNSVVSSTIIKKKQKKRRDPNGVVLKGTVGLFLPLDVRGRGRR